MMGKSASASLYAADVDCTGRELMEREIKEESAGIGLGPSEVIIVNYWGI